MDKKKINRRIIWLRFSAEMDEPDPSFDWQKDLNSAEDLWYKNKKAIRKDVENLFEYLSKQDFSQPGDVKKTLMKKLWVSVLYQITRLNDFQEAYNQLGYIINQAQNEMIDNDGKAEILRRLTDLRQKLDNPGQQE